jgi:hypothetical protein
MSIISVSPLRTLLNNTESKLVKLLSSILQLDRRVTDTCDRLTLVQVKHSKLILNESRSDIEKILLD